MHFKGSDMTEIPRVLNLLYNTYKNSSKKWREIQELFQSMKDDFDFEDSGLRPAKSYGTRWISHRLNALHKFYDKFKVFVLRLEKLIREATTKEKSTLEGVRRKVVSSSVIINDPLFSDILAPVKDLSIALQNNSLNIVDATTNITECIDYTKIC